MRTLKYLIIAAMATAIAFTSCKKEIEAPYETGQEEEQFSRETGAPVVFGVSTSYDNGLETPETKVEYSGATFTIDGKKYERIDWEVDDRLEIFCPQTSAPENKKAEYRISESPSNAGVMSKARISKVGSVGLQWGNALEHKFYAFYPKMWDGAPNKLNKILSGNISHISFFGEYRLMAEVPEIQGDGNKPIIVAAKKADKQTGGPVELDFKLAVNTFDISITNTRSETVNLKKVELAATFGKLSGTYKINLHTAQEQRNYSFNEPGLEQKDRVGYIFENTYALAPNQSCNVRLYTLPVDIKYLTLVLQFGNETVYLELKNRDRDWITFAKEMKYNLIDIMIPRDPVEQFNYTFSTDSDTWFFYPFDMRYPNFGTRSLSARRISSFRENADGTRKEAEAFGYSGADWLQESSGYYPSLSGDTQNIYMYLKEFDPEESELHDLYKALLLETEELSDYDLSTKGGTTPRNTANCYVVKQRGTYKFPVVYGNGIADDRYNGPAFTPNSPSNDPNVLNNFVDGAGTQITFSNIYFNASKVSLVWEDARGLIEKLYLKKGSDGKQYVHFKIGDAIDYGNALIAVKNSQDQILWTWHVWVTDVNFDIPSDQFLSVPLGYRPDVALGVDAKNYSFDLKQIDIKGKSKTMYANVLRGYSCSSCLYYKSGVMRPLIPTYRIYCKYEIPGGEYNNFASLANCYTAEFTENGSRQDTQEFELIVVPSSNKLSIAQAVGAPGKIFELERRHLNLWNNYYTNPANSELNTLKTVYDPCPAGYKMPTKVKLQNLPNNIKENFKMGGYRNNISYTQGAGWTISVENFLKECEILSTYEEPNISSLTDERAIIPIKE